MRKILTLTLLIFSLFTYTQATEKASEEPTMSITDIKGKTYQITGTEEGLNIEGMEGKIVFLEFFGHRCPPCLKSIPHHIKLQEKYKDKLAIIAIEVQGYNNKQLTEFVKEKGINYITATDRNAGNFISYISQRAEWRGSIPFLIALDTKGAVQFVQAGMLPEATLEELIKQLK
jgi:thiol-disulfide isomerase/thioredoxin